MRKSKGDHAMTTFGGHTQDQSKEITCSFCHAVFQQPDKPFHYCPFCGKILTPDTTLENKTSSEHALSSPVTLIKGHVPMDQSIQFTIGSYQILQSIGKGGMGEVFLAYDTSCGRRIALKRIRTDLTNHQQLYNRFLKEARITSQLTHPSIIPIYAIHSEENLIYYTMPFVEGETLKQILRKTKHQEKRGEPLDSIGGSIPSLIRIFINICQAVAYAHSKGVLHRDIKPENIIVGKFGEVLILDWGLAKLYKSTQEAPSEEFITDEDSEEESHPLHELTHTGKVVGTVTYMAPERALGHPATIQTDIYSLGVILYQLLTLKSPFVRGTLKEFRKNIQNEKFIDPAEASPYRDVPKILSHIARTCLEPNPTQRYESVEELIHELETYIEGRPEWFPVCQLEVGKKSDWEFQENVLIAEHIDIMRTADISEWVCLMISKESVQGNSKIEARVKIKERGKGIGFLLSIPEAGERENLNDGYCMWLGADNQRTTKLLRSNFEVLSAPDIFLMRHEWYWVRIEKIDNNLHFYLNDNLQFSYISHSPLIGTHVGLMTRDADFELQDFYVYSGGQNVTVNCLAVPDAFLANHDYQTALSEYRRIGYSFPGRIEGREALFRAGVTLLEQARSRPQPGEAMPIYDLAMKEFEKLHSTPGAPLEYLGKALVYEALHDYEEEIKCFELAYRRYPKHPLLPVLQEQIIYRMHESSHFHRVATYSFILLVLRHLPEVATSGNTQKLFSNLQKHWEPLPFILKESHQEGEEIDNTQFAITLAFWLAKPYVLKEILEELIKMENPPSRHVGNVLFCLVKLGSWKIAVEEMKMIEKSLPGDKLQQLQDVIGEIQTIILCHTTSLSAAVQRFIEHHQRMLSEEAIRTLIYLLEFGTQEMEISQVELLGSHLGNWKINESDLKTIHCCLIWAALIEKNSEKANEYFQLYPETELTKESSLLHFLYGCWLWMSEGKEIATVHFAGIQEVSYPRTWNLCANYLDGKIGRDQRWFIKAFMWEKRQLYKQLDLFYNCTGEPEKAHYYHHLEKQETTLNLE